MRRLRGKWAIAAVSALVAAAGVVAVVAGGDDDRPAAQQGNDVPERQARPDRNEPPTTRDHWHTAFGVYVCGSFLEAPDTGRDPVGLHTHGDGMIHVHPFTPEAGGRNATVGLFAESTGASLTDRLLAWAGQEWREGTATCGGRPAEVVVATPERRITEQVGAVRLLDCSWLTIAVVARGDEVPPPPTAGAFSELSDVRSPSACAREA